MRMCVERPRNYGDSSNAEGESPNANGESSNADGEVIVYTVYINKS